jgi:hypothetical protein
MVVSGILPNILSVELFFTSHMVFSWCSSKKLHQLLGRIALGLKLFSFGFLRGHAEEDEASRVRGRHFPFSHTLSYDYSCLVQVVRGITSHVYLTDSP